MSLLPKQVQHLIALQKILIEMSVVSNRVERLRREVEQDLRIKEPIVGASPMLGLLVISIYPKHFAQVKVWVIVQAIRVQEPLFSPQVLSH